MTEDEFLSKMKCSDKLHPVITIVMYYGEKEIFEAMQKEKATEVV